MSGGRTGARAVAAFEAAKGVLALVGALGLHELARPGARDAVAALLGHLRLNPAAGSPGVVRRVLDGEAPPALQWLALAALAYAAVRFAEAWGLWRQRAWALWLGIIGAALYVPFELAELERHHTPLAAAALVLNGAVLLWLLRHRAAFTRTSSPPQDAALS